MELEEIHEFNKAYRNEYRIESQILCSADTDIFNPHRDPGTMISVFAWRLHILYGRIIKDKISSLSTQNDQKLNVRAKTIKTLKESIGVNFCDPD